MLPYNLLGKAFLKETIRAGGRAAFYIRERPKALLAGSPRCLQAGIKGCSVQKPDCWYEPPLPMPAAPLTHAPMAGPPAHTTPLERTAGRRTPAPEMPPSFGFRFILTSAFLLECTQRWFSMLRVNLFQKAIQHPQGGKPAGQSHLKHTATHTLLKIKNGPFHVYST